MFVTTLETNRDKDYEKYSKAPPPSKRFKQFLALDYPHKEVTIEPVMDFNVDIFADWITEINPDRLWLGYNSHETAVFLPEPTHKQMMEFASLLVKRGLNVSAKDWRGLEIPEGVKATKK